MTTTELYSGINTKNSSRVLRPPGGTSSNIFGNAEERPQQAAPAPDQNQNQGGSAEAAPMQQQHQDRQQQQQQQQQGGQKQFKYRDFDPAPFASFTESGKKSHPTQFDDCSKESQNDADFRCYSVTAYREAIATNAAVKQRARGSAAGASNPITHEDSQPNPFRNYEQSRVHPQQVQHQQNQERTTGKRAQNTQRRGQYNPITGEEYTDGFGANEEEGEAEETEEQENDEPIDTTEEKEEPKPTPQEKPAEPPKDHNSYLVKKVRQPPGGASSGLW